LAKSMARALMPDTISSNPLAWHRAGRHAGGHAHLRRGCLLSRCPGARPKRHDSNDDQQGDSHCDPRKVGS
jgi:hypothetical protein